jgi:hypothetical protein
VRPALAALAVALFATVLGGTAQGAPRVGIACERPDDAARTRLVDELMALGYDVQDADAEEHERVGRRSGLSAHFVIGERRINVRVAQKDRDRFEVREAVIDLGRSRDDAATATTRAVEFLRASLIEVGATPPTPARAPAQEGRSRSPAPTPVVPAGSADRGSGISLAMGGGLLHSTGGVGSNATFAPAIGFSLSPAVGLRILAAIPVSPAVLRAPEGEASVRPSIFALSAWWTPVRWQWLTPYAELAISAAFVSISARASEGYTARDETASSALPLVGAGAVFFPGRVRLRAGVIAGPALRREHVRFAGRDVGVWGEWVSGGLAALEVVLP